MGEFRGESKGSSSPRRRGPVPSAAGEEALGRRFRGDDDGLFSPSSLRARMRRVVHLREVLKIEMRINLRRPDIRVA